MEHKWTYNHRINRMGNYVSFDGEKGYSLHSSATGLGSDSSFSKTHYTYVESPNLYFKEILVEVTSEGKEGELLTAVNDVKIPIEDWMKGKGQYIALINGFEITSIGKADQLQLFRCFVETPRYDDKTGFLHLRTQVDLVTNCRSLECQLLNRKTGYDLKLPILIIAFDDEEAASINTHHTMSYKWTKLEEAKVFEKDIAIRGRSDQFNQACIGISGLGLVLNKQHWLLEHKSYVNASHYEPVSSTLTSSISMQFLAWSKEMGQSKVSPVKAKFAKKKKGYALLDMNTILVQMKEGRIKHSESESSLFWRGKNQHSSSEFAQSKIDLTENLSFE